MKCIHVCLLVNNVRVVMVIYRYLLIYGPPRILRRHELNAFLATGVSPVLQDVDFIQDLKVRFFRISQESVQVYSMRLCNVIECRVVYSCH